MELGVFHHESQKNMTKLLVPKSEFVWKQLGDDVVDHVRHF